MSDPNPIFRERLDGGSLSRYRFQSVYETGRTDLVTDFYTPCLSEANEYCRAVGFFSSSLLPLISEGLERFVQRRGRMRLVVSPALSAEDAGAIEKGYRDRSNLVEPLGNALLRNLEELHRSGELRAAVANLAWLVANGIIDVKVAVPIRDGEVVRGMYHEKLGYFRDAAAQVVAFQGSQNETQFAVWANFESLWVYTSWESDPPPPHLGDIERMFEDRWRDATPGLLVVDFPQAPRKWLEEHAPVALELSKTSPPGALGRRPLRPYQKEALDEWIRHGRRGILAMATGTGKTLVALAAIEQEICEGRSVVVAVPTRALRAQWDREVRASLDGIGIVSLAGDQEMFQPGVIETCLAGPKPIVLIGVMDSLTKERFLERAQRCLARRQFSLVVDEVHRIGSDARSRIMELRCEHRLGLSATPDRPWDEEGNEAIRSYFGEVVFRFDIGDAIQRGVLSPYRYYPEEVPLGPREQKEVEQLAQRITIAMARLAKQLDMPMSAGVMRILTTAYKLGLPDAPGLTAALQQRADVTKKAEAKVALAEGVFHKHPKLRRVLVYCDDNEQLVAVNERLLAAGISTVQYVGEMDEAQRTSAIRAIEGGTARAVLSMRCLDEGVDLPSCDGALILASSKTWREFVQRRGRVLRRHPEKAVATIIDPIVVPPPGRSGDAMKAMVSSELSRSCVFIRDASNRGTAEATARRIASSHGIDFAEVENYYRDAL